MAGNQVMKAIYDLPDLQFAKWCEETFAINRGVYNTIDEKLYEAGYENIVGRREAIITFLETVVKQEQSAKFFKFGHGNLSTALHQFSMEV